MGLMHWIFGKHPPRPPDPERTCEAAWLPMWQAQLVLYELWESDIPAVMSEDFTSHLRFAARGPMARIFVTEPRLAAATEVIERVHRLPARPPGQLDRARPQQLGGERGFRAAGPTRDTAQTPDGVATCESNRIGSSSMSASNDSRPATARSAMASTYSPGSRRPMPSARPHRRVEVGGDGGEHVRPTRASTRRGQAAMPSISTRSATATAAPAIGRNGVALDVGALEHAQEGGGLVPAVGAQHPGVATPHQGRSGDRRPPDRDDRGVVGQSGGDHTWGRVSSDLVGDLPCQPARFG